MTTRRMKPSDIPALRAMEGEHPYPRDFSKLEAVQVVVDDEDRPVMACGAERICQLYLWCGSIKHPLARLHALRLLHEAMAMELRRLGYKSAEAFIPPNLAKRFARRLERTFGWCKNWPSWTHPI